MNDLPLIYPHFGIFSLLRFGPLWSFQVGTSKGFGLLLRIYFRLSCTGSSFSKWGFPSRMRIIFAQNTFW